MSSYVYRAWINQPGDQPLNKFNGLNVLVRVENKTKIDGSNYQDIRAYFLSGDIVSIQLDSLLYVSDGWLK